MEMWIEMTDSFLNYFDVKNETEFQQLFNKFLWVVKLEIFVVLASSVWNFNQNFNDAIQSFHLTKLLAVSYRGFSISKSTCLFIYTRTTM